ncbi:ATP-dependent zinc metalloprotease FtsH [Paraburkholderia ultramafica]|uniref:ATP-dependent zinc metalloprotease FtsH n=1 Tax=Paraburkholderia ultramafica TaxID=1544867 RepID=A0A6S7BI76_9BURK|nr:ATP-binding protein [Paraburkholderia ultramafica]CAB3800477.1 ATP-dependent zinc metalloprotease FtsH [Paraburkholderia ultramafica]
MNLFGIQKLYRAYRAPDQLIINGGIVTVPLEAKITRAAPTVVARTGPAQPIEAAPSTPAARVMSAMPAGSAEPAISTASQEPAIHEPLPRPTVTTEQPRAPVPQKPSGLAQPKQPPQPEYTFNHLVQRARFNFSAIVGMAETKKRMLAAAREILALQDQGKGTPQGQPAAKSRNGMLFFGEPGNGKTLFAEALAGELNVPFLSIAYGDVASKWVNETPQKIKAVFDQARRKGAGVLFIDEFDSFVKSRDAGGAHSMDQDMTNVLLTEIVSLRGTPVVLVAATNFIDNLDRASIREGRFDYKIEVPPPDFEARRAILNKTLYTAFGQGCIYTGTLTNLAERWEGFSASRLDSLGGQLKEMRNDGTFGPGRVTFDIAMKAMRLLQGRKGKLPENVKPIDEIIMPEQSREVLRDLAFKMKNVYNLEKIGGRIPAGLVFAGPPGTGKTEAGRSLAKESDFAFLETTGAKIVADPGLWDKLVREARDIRPTIVFIDEADDVLRDRRFSNVATLTNNVLTTMDGAAGRMRDIVYIAATNHLEQFDSAALRGGRFEEKILFDVPGSEDMARYASAKLTRLAGSTYEIMPDTRARLLDMLAGRSIADADAVMQKAIDAAAVRALRESVNEIRPEDVEHASRTVLNEQELA